MRGRWVNAALGIWLFLAAWLFAGEPGELANNLFLGLAVFLFSFMAMGIDGFRRLNTVLGLWAVVSPFLLGYGDYPGAVNDVIVGILVIAASLWTPEREVPRQHRLA